MSESSSKRDPTISPPSRSGVVGLALILILAAALRLYNLSGLPAGFFCDEAGLGYNAYSILETGRDETGAFLPLYVWSFDVSYKNPIFVYSAIVPVAVLGLTEAAVRLTAALYGIATVAAIFFLGRALMGPGVGLLAAAFLAVCPWHLHFSRIGFELVTFPFFFIVGMTCLVRWTQGRRLLAAAMLLFGVTLYTYAIAKLFVPLFVLGFSAFYWRALLNRWRESLVAFAVLVVSVAPLIAFDLSHSERSTAYFQESTILNLESSPLALVKRFGTNYTAFFDPDFLFTTGDTRLRHAVREHGELYPFFAPLLLLGVFTVLVRREQALLLPLWWLVIYPVAPALMTEIPSASRGFIGAAAFCLFAAIGAGAILGWPAQRLRQPRLIRLAQAALMLLGLVILVPEIAHYWILYSREYPRYAAKFFTGFQYGKREVIDYFAAHQEDYDQMVLTTHLSNQAHVFPLFYERFSPTAFQRDGMAAISRDAKISIAPPERVDLYQQYPRILFAVRETELGLFADYELKRTVRAPDGSVAFQIIEVRALKDFIHDWEISQPFPADAKVTAPAYRALARPNEEADDDEDAELRWYTNPSAAVAVNEFFKFKLPATETSCAWAVTEVWSETEQEVDVFAGFFERGEIWLNGEGVETGDTTDDPSVIADSESARVLLLEGDNAVAIKTCGRRDYWRFYFRLQHPDGNPVDGLEWATP